MLPLPGNYQVIGEADGQTVIGGRDVAGWTLDAYVIPRLAPGLYFASEIDLSDPVMSQITEPTPRVPTTWRSVSEVSCRVTAFFGP